MSNAADTIYDETAPEAEFADPAEPADETEEVEEELDSDADFEEYEETGTGSSKATARNRGLSVRDVRRVANKTVEVVETDARTVEIARSILGCGAGAAEIATAIMTSARTVTEPIRDLNMIAESDMFEAGINAASLTRDRLKAVWALLGALGKGSKQPMPTAHPKAALAAAKLVFGLDDATKAEVEAVATLLKKN